MTMVTFPYTAPKLGMIKVWMPRLLKRSIGKNLIELQKVKVRCQNLVLWWLSIRLCHPRILKSDEWWVYGDGGSPQINVEENAKIEEGELVAESSLKEDGGEVTPLKYVPVSDAPLGSLLKGLDHVITQNLSQNLSWADDCCSQETDPTRKIGRPNKSTQREREAKLNKKLGNQSLISEILKGKKISREGKDGGRSPSTHKYWK